MQIIDMHSHWSTRRGYALRTEQEQKLQKRTWNSEAKFLTEQEMTDDFRRANVRTILDLGFTKFIPLEEVSAYHDYALEVQAAHSDVIIGNWLHIHPSTGQKGVDELRRCVEATSGFIGFAVSGIGTGPGTDPIWEPFYDYCISANVPIMMFTGTVGLGAGMPGGRGFILDHCHPRHIDEVAARHPDLTIVAGRLGWPWQTELIAVMLHKPNVWQELHGWSPKYFTDDLKHEIPRRLKDRIMFGADYPLLSYERLIREWNDLGYSEDVLARVFHKNAESFFERLAAKRPGGAAR